MNSLDLSQINVVAMNTTCWAKNDPSRSQTQEPILVAVASLDVASRQVVEQRSYLIKPRYAAISDHCTRVTGITREMAASGMSYEAVCEELVLRFQSRNRQWASYGTFPWLIFGEQSKRVRNQTPLSPRFFNLKHMTAVTFQLAEEVSLPKAIDLAGVPYYGHHNHAEEAVVMLADLMKFFLGRLHCEPMSFDLPATAENEIALPRPAGCAAA